MAFLAAAYQRDYAGMEAALDSREDLYSEDPWGNTALHYAVFCSNENGNGWCKRNSIFQNQNLVPEPDNNTLGMVKFLFQNEDKWMSPTGCSEQEGTRSIFVNKINKDGWTPLNYAASGNRNLIKTVKELLNRGADINNTPNDGLKGAGDTSLIKSVWGESYEVTDLLLERGAKVDIYRKNSWNVLLLACTNAKPELAKAILQKKGITPEFVNLTGESGDTALNIAIANGLSEIVPILLSHGASLYTENTVKIESLALALPNSFEKFFDNQISVKKRNKETGGESRKVSNTQIDFDYNFMRPVYDSTQNEEHSLLQVTHYTETKVLEDTVTLSEQHKTLLKHPLSRALLMMKWKKIEILYWVWIFTKFLFLILLLSVAYTQQPFLHNCMRLLQTNTSSTTMDNTTMDNTTMDNRTEDNTSDELAIDEFQPQTRLYTLHVFNLLLAFMIIMEMLQIGVSVSWWIKEAKNHFQLLIMALCITLVYDLSQEDPNCELDLHLLGFLIPMVFYELLHEIGYHPSFAKYILLLDRVCRTFIFYGGIYIGLVIMPAFSFYLIIIEKTDADLPKDFSKLLAKTVVMFVGEVELFEVSQNVGFKWLEVLFFFFFIFFLVVVLMNLLNALAIVDTKDLLEDVDLEMLSSLLETVSFWENLHQNDPHRKFGMSFLREMNNLICPKLPIFKIVPNISVLNDDGFIRLRAYKEKDIKDSLGEFGGSIVIAALDVVNKREEEERKKQEIEKTKKKEEEREEKEARNENMIEIIFNHRVEKEEQCERLIKMIEEKEAKYEKLIELINNKMDVFEQERGAIMKFIEAREAP